MRNQGASMTHITRRAFVAVTAGATATATVLAGGTPAGADGRQPPPEQLRGMWIATVTDDDWPSVPGLTADQQRAELTALLDVAAARRLNVVYLQVRPSADAFWPSPYEPWSQYLTGTQGT